VLREERFIGGGEPSFAPSDRAFSRTSRALVIHPVQVRPRSRPGAQLAIDNSGSLKAGDFRLDHIEAALSPRGELTRLDFCFASEEPSAILKGRSNRIVASSLIQGRLCSRPDVRATNWRNETPAHKHDRGNAARPHSLTLHNFSTVRQNTRADRSRSSLVDEPDNPHETLGINLAATLHQCLRSSSGANAENT
jgi:hypothetical protein